VILTLRYLGVSGNGILNFAISTIGISTVFMDFGMSIYIVRDLSRDDSTVNKYLGNIIPLKIILSTITIITVCLILKIFNYSDLKILLCLIMGIQSGIGSMAGLFYGIFQASNKMKYQAIGLTINSIFLLLIIIIVIRLNLEIVSIALAYLLSSIISTIYLIKIVRNLVKNIKIGFDFSFWFETLKKSAPFAMTTLFVSFLFTTDQIMISAISGDFALGIYNCSYKILTVFITIYSMYTIAVFPLMSRLYNKLDDILKISYEKSVKYLLALALPLCVGISFYAKNMVILIAGTDYIDAGPLLQVLIWNITFVFVNGISDQLLNSTNHEMAVLKRTAIAGVFNFALNLVLISKFSYFGATISTLLSGLLILILNNYLISKALFKIDNTLIKDVVKIIISSSILAIVLYLIHVSMWLSIPIGVIIYVIAILLMKTLDKDDIYIIKELLGKNN
jgi:O-antigen/teichoic acid export membrane protein